MSKTAYLEKQPDVPSTQRDEEASNKVGTTPQATKVFTHRKSAKKSMHKDHHGETKTLRNVLFAIRKNVKKDVLYH